MNAMALQVARPQGSLSLLERQAGLGRSDGGERETTPEWVRICRVDQLPVERGVAALVNGHQVALFRLFDGTVAAVGNRDPFSGANVMSRGLVGSKGDVPVVFSPMYKHVFSLVDGACVTEAGASLGRYPVRQSDGWVEIGLQPGSAPGSA